MKSIIKATLLLGSALVAFVSAQDNSRGEFYVKDDVKGFLGLSLGYGMHSQSLISGVNNLAFTTGWGFNIIEKDSTGTPVDTSFITDNAGLFQYNQFGLGALHGSIQLGAQYHKFLTWFDAAFLPTQVSEVPAAVRAAELIPFHHDVQWFRLGFNWMFGYEFLGGASPITLIPAMGFGFSELAIRFAAPYDLDYEGAADEEMVNYSLENSYYSASGKTFAADLEVRLRLTKTLSLGVAANMQYFWFDQMVIESTKDLNYIINVGELGGAFYGGALRIVYTLPSTNERNAAVKQ